MNNLNVLNKLKTKTYLLSVAAMSLALTAPTAMANDVEQPRIISAGSAVTELVLALGAEEQLVGIDVTSRFPQSEDLPKIGYHRNLSAEGLLALEPTTLIGSDEMGPDNAISQLKSAGVDVEIVNTEANVEGLLKRIDQIAKITHTEDHSQQVKADVNQKIAALKANQVPKNEAKKVLFLLLHEGRPANVAGGETSPNAIIELAGGINPAAQSLTSYKPLSMESLVEMQPDVILVSGRSYQKMGDADAILKSLPMLAATPAGMNKQIITVNGSALVGGLGLESLSEAKRLNALIYPL
ncbi:Periplasmic hemin-binding protein [Vibrio chagasii]|uniref:heme/hemin ABC transporter substrate-binding protein n=1 Tax=Vibrio splendidus TaxID=29497 RepID=UPI000E32A3E6|nr:ABC transporter substrate-binding protein [Vibrio splendidus]CAH7232390.1 Periplasmic hemin-binding protein [Vibrio chagasii]CAH7295686.1 Periplasmic hemin-binding protein [Vibrio chagasii]CAH7339633.1 Periplasmic hemin-binding protein [Vibrio chagasii]CAH7441121.1 Periplasmic hemin-binding protein [Vibrio chagasii]CAH7464780.1 Periplasmic hemin-binding protein [Vibrio chagasii]